jgi:hypothetical protein
MDELKRRAYCKWHNSFSHATNDCNVFRRQIQSAINEGRLAFQEMQVDTQSFSINTIELTRKKVLVRPEVADKGKGKTSSLAILARQIYHKKRLLGRLRTERLTSSKALGSRLNQADKQNSLTRASWTVRHLRTYDPVLMRMVWLTQPDSPPMTKGVNLHTKQGKRCKGKANITHMVGW